MRILDRSTLFWGRTVREVVLIACGAAFTAYAAFGGDRALFVGVYGFATIAFALRFYPARAFAVGTCISALAQSAAGGSSLLGTFHENRFEDWTLYVPLPFLALTVSRDLVERFDRAPVRWNLWVHLPHADAFRLRICIYAMASLAASLVVNFNGAVWMIAAMASLWLGIALLALGRAVVLLIAPILALASATAWTLNNHTRATDLVPAVCAFVVVVAALPYAARLLRRVS